MSQANHGPLGTGTGTGSPDASAPPSGAPVHFVVHNGDFLNADSLLRGRAVSALDLLLRDDAPVDGWLAVLAEAEDALRAAYRCAFSSPTVCSVLRRCGNIFLAGSGEAAGELASFLVMAARPKQTDRGADGGGDNVSIAMTAATGVTGVTGVTGLAASQVIKAVPKPGASVGVGDDQSVTSASVDNTAASLLSMADIAKRIVADAEEEAGYVDALTEAQEELRLLLAGAFLRMARCVAAFISTHLIALSWHLMCLWCWNQESELGLHAPAVGREL